MNNDLINFIENTARETAAINKVVLFGSRARGDGNSKSDFDIAVFGSLTKDDKAILESRFKFDAPTLQKIDIIFFDTCKSTKLKENILKDGIILYEKD